METGLCCTNRDIQVYSAMARERRMEMVMQRRADDNYNNKVIFFICTQNCLVLLGVGRLRSAACTKLSFYFKETAKSCLYNGIVIDRSMSIN